MKTLHRNKKRLNANTLNESDYYVLTYEELLKVNGRGSTPSGGNTGPTYTQQRDFSDKNIKLKFCVFIVA